MVLRPPGALVVADRATAAGVVATAMGLWSSDFGDHAASPAGSHVARIAREAESLSASTQSGVVRGCPKAQAGE